MHRSATLLSDEAIGLVRSGGTLSNPDPRFVAMVRGQYRRFARCLRHRDFDDVLQDALVFYWRACLDYDPARRYSRGAVGFVGGRVVARLRNSFRTDARRRRWIGEYPSDPETGRQLDVEDVDACPVDASALYREVVRRAEDALACGEDRIAALVSAATGGDREAVEALRGAVLGAEEGDMGRGTGASGDRRELMYQRPIAERVEGLMTVASVLEGLRALNLLAPFAKLRGTKADKRAVTGHLAEAIRYLDEAVDDLVASSGKAMECVVEVEGTKGCGSIIPDVPVCPYCGEIFEVVDDDLPPEVSEADEAAEARKREAADKLRAEIEAENAAKVERRKAENAARKATQRKRAKDDDARGRAVGNPKPIVGRPRLGSCPIATFRAFVESHPGVELRDRGLFYSLWLDGTKVCTARKDTSVMGLPVSYDVFRDLAASRHNAVAFYDRVERKKRHYGRDSVICKTDDPEVVGELLEAALHCSGAKLLDPDQVVEAEARRTATR